MAYDFNLTRIDNTDTFKEWADKCNAIIEGLNTTDFVTSSSELMTLSSTQTATGQKTFRLSTNFNNGIVSAGTIISNGNFTFDGTTGIINTKTLQVNSGNFTTGSGFEVIGSKGISFKSSPTSSVASLKFENAGTPEKIVFDYSGTGDGIFEVADGNKLSLAGSSPTIGVNEYEWELPGTTPGTTPSYLKWVGSGSEVSWFSQTDLAAAIVTDVRDLLQASNFTLPVTLIPVGTMIAVDARILDSWAVAGSPEEYTIWSGAPGWLVCNGQTLTFDEDVSPQDTTYRQLINLLEGPDSPAGSATSTVLPDTVGSPGEEDPIGGNNIVYLIKYKEDDTTAFSISTTTGVAGASGINLFDTSNANVASFDIEGGKIGLNIDTADFEFGSGGELSFAHDIDTAATPDTLAERDPAGALSVATPTANEHATTKAFVDTSLDTLGDTLRNELTTSVRAFPELIDGHQSFAEYSYRSMTFVDKFGRGIWAGLNIYQRNGALGSGEASTKAWFNAFSPITDKETLFKRTFPTNYNWFFIDNDDILYGTGRNDYGQIGQQDRGTVLDFADYYSFYPGNKYNDTQVETPIPAMLPQKSVWPANAITVDTVSYHNDEYDPLIIIKTKDGIGKEYVNGQRSQGFVKYETDENAVGLGGADVPYTRGWLIACSRSFYGALGDGDTSTRGTYYTTTGPKLFGLQGAGSSLWAVYALADAERGTVSSMTSAQIAQVNKRLHYFKKNATKAGGLGATDGTALAEWRTQLGFSGSETFDEYSYYIKKTVVTTYGTHVIIGKPGNESDNEIWHAGYNGFGPAGNGAPTTADYRHVPATDAGTISSLSVSVVAGTSNRVFESSTPHGFEDFEQMTGLGGSTRYYIVRGDGDNNNLTTRFRLFRQSGGEQWVYDAIADGGTANGKAVSDIATRVLRVHKKVKGIFDISVGSGNVNNSQVSVITRRTTDTTTNTQELDALPETEFDSVSVMTWGDNAYGQLGLGSNRNRIYTPRTVSLGTSDRPVDIIGVMTGFNSFVVTENENGNRSIRVCGNNTAGLSDVGTITNTDTTTFTLSATIDANWWVKKVFVSSGPLWSTAWLGRIFIVAQSKTDSDCYALFAGGWNRFGQFGTSQRYNNGTENYIRVPFPEDAKNIVAMQNAGDGAYYALCKTEESGETAEEFAEKGGRLYTAGRAHYYLQDGVGLGSRRQGHTGWHPADTMLFS